MVVKKNKLFIAGSEKLTNSVRMLNTRGGVRHILISGLTRNQLIDFIKRKDHTYTGHDLSSYSENGLRELAHHVDKKSQEIRRSKQSLKR